MRVKGTGSRRLNLIDRLGGKGGVLDKPAFESHAVDAMATQRNKSFYYISPTD